MILVLIQWKDPTFCGEHWEDREPYVEVPVNCVSCGILLHECEDSIQVVMNLNSKFYSQGISYPKSIIKRMWKVKASSIIER